MVSQSGASVNRDMPVSLGDTRRVAGRRDMDQLGSLLGRVLGEVASRTGSAAGLFPVWREVVGELIARHSSPVSLAGGVLRVRVDEEGWRAELASRAEELRGRLSARLGEGIVRRVDFFVP